MRTVCCRVGCVSRRVLGVVRSKISPETLQQFHSSPLDSGSNSCNDKPALILSATMSIWNNKVEPAIVTVNSANQDKKKRKGSDKYFSDSTRRSRCLEFRGKCKTYPLVVLSPETVRQIVSSTMEPQYPQTTSSLINYCIRIAIGIYNEMTGSSCKLVNQKFSVVVLL